jgi:hypothetical protein
MYKVYYCIALTASAIWFMGCHQTHRKTDLPFTDSLSQPTKKQQAHQPVVLRSLPEYDYDTLLKGGYRISFRADDSSEHLFLVKGADSKEIAEGTRGMLYKNLGYEAADFDDFFVLVHSYGSGNPHNIELIEKRSGNNILESDAIWIDANEGSQILLYTREDTAGKKMTLYDVRTHRKLFLDFPRGFSSDPLKLMNIRIIRVDPGKLSIACKVRGIEKIIVYER